MAFGMNSKNIQSRNSQRFPGASQYELESHGWFLCVVSVLMFLGIRTVCSTKSVKFLVPYIF